jgi:hypothetical protein
VDELIKCRLAEVSFDTTIVCTITDDADKANGVYKVTDGSITFEAICDTSDKYIKGDSVYVTVPQGDYANTKVIVSKYTKETAN